MREAREVARTHDHQPEESASGVESSPPVAGRPGKTLWGGPLVAIMVGLLAVGSDLPAAACWTAAITALCAVWWVTEPVPIPVTSLVPFAALPLTGVLDHRKVAEAYGHTLILLLLAGFMLSTAMASSGAHRRLSLGMARLVGGERASARRVVLGFMLASALSSMWMSNTATTLILLPVALATIERSGARGEGPFAAALLLGIAYASSVGGLGTPIGTPPNILFMAAYQEATGTAWSFLDWMKIGVPVVVVLTPLAWWVLTHDLSAERQPPVESLGPIRPRERRVLIIFALTAIGWVTRSEPFGGWEVLLHRALGSPAGGPTVGDATVALAALLALFVLPDGEGRGERLLDFRTAQKIPWGLLLLFGGGLAIAKAFGSSGLSAAIGDRLEGLATIPPVLMIASLCLAVTFLTEVTSNTATAALLLPLLGAAALGSGREPASLMVPAALSASCAFMLPVATVPNAIVFGTDRVPAQFMARRGFVLNLIGAALITVVTAFLL